MNLSELILTYPNLSEPFHTYPNLFEPTQVTDMSSPLNLMVVSVLQCTVIQLWSLSELHSHAQQIFRWQLLRCLVLIGTTKSFLKQVGHYSYSSGFLWRLQNFDKNIFSWFGISFKKNYNLYGSLKKTWTLSSQMHGTLKSGELFLMLSFINHSVKLKPVLYYLWSLHITN